MNDQNVSKWLSYVLRHKPDAAGLTLDENGWVYIPELIKASKDVGKVFDIHQLIRVVETDNKKRYAISNEGMIRASQGHSIEVDLGYKEMIPPPLLYHGTATRFIDAIVTEGIRKMGRHHVHLSELYDTAAAVGKRHGILLMLRIDSLQMHEDGLKFFKSDNGVWLTDHVDPKYIRIAVTP